MARSEFAAVTPLFRGLWIAVGLGYLIAVVAAVLDTTWRDPVSIVAGVLSIALGLVAGLDVGGFASRMSTHRRRAVGGEQPLDSVTGMRISYLVIFGGLGLALATSGVWGVLH